MATAQATLTRKLKPEHVRQYKAQWEKHCSESVYALARKRLSFYYSMYKNPPRIREVITQIPKDLLVAAADRVADAIAAIPVEETKDWLGGFKQNPRNDRTTRSLLNDIKQGLVAPQMTREVKGHPKDALYPYDFGDPNGLNAFYSYDLFCQLQVQVAIEARAAIPLEDLYRYTREGQFDSISGQLICFTVGVWGRDLAIPDEWESKPVSQLQARKTIGGRLYRTTMSIRNMYLFSTTSAVNLQRARVTGVGIFGGAVREGREIELSVVPLLIGMGGLSTSARLMID